MMIAVLMTILMAIIMMMMTLRDFLIIRSVCNSMNLLLAPPPWVSKTGIVGLGYHRGPTTVG